MSCWGCPPVIVTLIQIYPLTVFHSVAGQRFLVMGYQPQGLGLGPPSRSGPGSVGPTTGL